MTLMGIRLEADAPIAGAYLRDLASSDRFFHVVAIRRRFTTIIPNGDCMLMPDDVLFVTTTASRQSELARLTGKTMFDIHRVLVAGGGKTVEMMLGMAPRGLHFTVIESNATRAEELIRKCPNCDVIMGEAGEIDVLEEAGVSKADAFVALTGTSEGNILSCLTAKDLGIRKTVAHVGQQHLLQMAEAFNIGTIVNKQRLMANTIFQLMIDSGSLSSKCLALSDAEMVRLAVRNDSKIAGKIVCELKIPREITLASIIRGGRSQVVTGQTMLKAGDHVLVVCLQGGLRKAKKFFS